ncbi:hypothetical protein BDR06DRAFT_955605 [Suillus hirtellus]|nr:hypothetical protein BDR06DRAFT_955605 [Suillus hirtellus]
MGSVLLVRIASQGSLSRIHPKTPSLLYDTVRSRSSPFQTDHAGMILSYLQLSNRISHLLPISRLKTTLSEQW